MSRLITLFGQVHFQGMAIVCVCGGDLLKPVLQEYKCRRRVKIVCVRISLHFIHREETKLFSRRTSLWVTSLELVLFGWLMMKSDQIYQLLTYKIHVLQVYFWTFCSKTPFLRISAKYWPDPLCNIIAEGFCFVYLAFRFS